MEITLEQIDLVRERTGAGYKEAKEALEQSNGDVLEAIIQLENKSAKTGPNFGPKIESIGNEVLETLKELIRKGNVTRFYLEKDGRTILDIPVLAGAIGVLIFTGASAVAIVAALASGCELKIVKQDGEIIDLKNVTEETFQKVKAKVEELKTTGKKDPDDSCGCDCDCNEEGSVEEETEVIVEESQEWDK
jgi:translation elongation factor EF-Ts